MSRYSRRQRIPIAIIASMKTPPPATVIAIAKMIPGTATRIRRSVSPPPRLRGAAGSALRGARFFLPRLGFFEPRRRLGGRASGSGSGSGGCGWNISSSKKSLTGPSPSAAPEAPLTLRVGAQRALERRPVEVRPQLLGEDELRVGALPEQIVGDPLLAAGSDQEVGIVHVGRVEVTTELLLGAPLEVSRRIDNLRPTAVIEGDEETQCRVRRGLLFRPFHPLDQPCVDPLAAADEAHPHSLLVELRRLPQDPLAEHRHQPRDLLRRA